MQPTTVKAGIVGLGLVSTSHLKGYESHPRAGVTAVCDLDPERAARFAAAHGIPEVYTSYAEMLARADINTVDIATPTHLHVPMVVQAARAGKHVHCEKPFCRTVGEGLAACAAARQAGVKLVVGETYVFISSHVKARELIDAGEIGRPLQIRQRHGAWIARDEPAIAPGPRDRSWRVDPRQSGGGDYPWIYDHAVHFFATAEYLMQDKAIAQVYAVASAAPDAARRRGAAHDPYATTEADIPIITWRYADPACQGVWMRAERLNNKYDYMRGFSTTVVGERGMIEVLGEGGHNLVWEGRQQHLVLHREGKESVAYRFDEGGDDLWQSEICYYSGGHIAQVHHLIESILSESEPRYTGEDGVHAVRCTLATIESARTGRPVSLDEISPDYAAYAPTRTEGA
jgi:predicted dehydrogenase